MPGGAAGAAKQGGCAGLGSRVRGESSLREQKPAAVQGGGQGWADVPSWGSGVLVGPGSPHFPGLGQLGCCSLGVCTLPCMSASQQARDLPWYPHVVPLQGHLLGANGLGVAPAPGNRTPRCCCRRGGQAGLSPQITRVGHGTEKLLWGGWAASAAPSCGLPTHCPGDSKPGRGQQRRAHPWQGQDGT